MLAPAPRGDPHRARRLHDRDRRQLPGRPPELPQRRRRAVRRLELVHRSVLRHRHRLRGRRADREQNGCHVYRVDAGTGQVSRVADDFERPNGLAFSIDEKKLYIADSGRTHGEELPHHIRVFDVLDGKTLKGGEVFAVCEPGFFDGFRLDEQGNIWTSAGDGVQCFAPDGTLIGKIKLPEGCANVCFGMLRNDRLFMTATTSVYAIYLLVRGHRTF